jgi:hypothetical protein
LTVGFPGSDLFTHMPPKLLIYFGSPAGFEPATNRLTAT